MFEERLSQARSIRPSLRSISRPMPVPPPALFCLPMVHWPLSTLNPGPCQSAHTHTPDDPAAGLRKPTSHNGQTTSSRYDMSRPNVLPLTLLSGRALHALFLVSRQNCKEMKSDPVSTNQTNSSSSCQIRQANVQSPMLKNGQNSSRWPQTLSSWRMFGEGVQSSKNVKATTEELVCLV